MKATTTKDARPVTMSAPVPIAFSRPDLAFRGFPLWSWNGRLERIDLDPNWTVDDYVPPAWVK